MSVSTCGELIHGGAYIRGAYSRRFTVVAIFKYSGYSETVKLGGVTNLVETTSV